MSATEQKKTAPKSVEDVTIQDNFLFGTLLRDPDICREILQRILGIPIGHIDYPTSEKTIETGYYNKGIRLDILTDLPDQSICCVEMQIRRSGLTGFRSCRNAPVTIIPPSIPASWKKAAITRICRPASSFLSVYLTNLNWGCTGTRSGTPVLKGTHFCLMMVRKRLF